MLKDTRDIPARLRAADRTHQQEAGGRFLLGGVKYVCAVVLALFVADVVLQLRSGWRLGLLLALAAGVCGLLSAAWYLAFVRRNRLEYIARVLEAREPALGSRLINLLQLQAQADDGALPALTRDLARQAVAHYDAGLQGTTLEKLAWTGELRRHFLRAAMVGLGFLVVLAVFFRVSAVEIARFADPFGDHPPYSFTRLEIVEPGLAGTNVLYGKSLVVRVKAFGHQPKDVFLTFFPTAQPQQAVTVPMFEKGRVGFDQLVDNIRGDLVLYAHTKNRVSFSKQVRIGVILTPQLEKIFVRVTPPAYTELKGEETPYAFKSLSALAGSEIRFRLQSNRPLRDGTIEITAGDQPPQRVTLSASGPHEVSGGIVAKDSGRLRFALRDVAGIPTQKEAEGALIVTHDLPPEVRLAEPERDAFVAMDFKVKTRVEANDDYGLRFVRLHRGLNGAYSTPKSSAYSSVARTVAETTELNIGQLGVQPGDVISLFAEAGDTAPDPHVARSQVVRLLVISVEEYNDFLRENTDLADAQEKYDSLTRDLQELIEGQEKLGAAAQQLQERLGRAEGSEREAQLRELDQLLARQNELNQKLKQHAERLDHFVRENPVYDVEKELEKVLREQADQIRHSASTNNAAAAALARRTSPEQGPRQLSSDMLEDFKRESDNQTARLGKVQETTKDKVVQPLEDMSAMHELVKDFNQFESLYRTQTELAAQAQAYQRAGELSREDQLALKELAATEKEIGDMLETLSQKLRTDARAADKLFPKAAASGRQLAQQIDALRMPPLAREATRQMLDGNGQGSFRTADRLRGEMEKLFAQCQGGQCPSGNELDQYLQLQRAMAPGKNFAQMARSRKFGQAGQQGAGLARGQEGLMGSSGYAVAGQAKVDVLGNEFSPSRSSATAKQGSPLGKGTGAAAGGAQLADIDRPDVVKGLNPINRQSGAVNSEVGVEEYNDVVENYFKALTTRKRP